MRFDWLPICPHSYTFTSPVGQAGEGEQLMQDMFLHLYVKLKTIVDSLKDESGQDLIEYALVVALIAFAATAGMSSVATGINTAFNHLAVRLNSYIS